LSDSNFDRFLRRVHSDCVNASDAPGGELGQEGVARLVSAAFNLNGEIDQLRAEEREYNLLDAVRRLAPYLNRYCDLGWPGLSERDRDEANNARVDLLNAAGLSGGAK